MKKKLAMLFVVIMLLSCMPVMAVTVPAGADTAAATTGTVTTQAASTGWIKVDKYYRYYYAKGKYYTNCVKKIENKLFGFNKSGNLCCGWFTINNATYYGSVKQGAKGIGVGQILTGYRKIGNDYYYLKLPQPCQERRPRHRIYHDRQEAVLFQPCHRQAAPHKGLVLHRLFHVLCAGGRHDCH